MFWIYTSRPDCEREPGPGGTGRFLAVDCAPAAAG